MKIEEAKEKLSVVRGRIAMRLPDTHESIEALDLALWLMAREALVRAAVECELVEEALPALDRLETWERDNPMPGENT